MGTRRLRYTLLGDGPSDRILRFPVEWLLRFFGAADFDGNWAPGTGPLGARVGRAVSEFPCDLLIVHRDAEREPIEKREEEVRRALEEAKISVRAVAVVPVRMTEAWLLFDEPALRRAAGNPNGQVPLRLPRLVDVEGMHNPKDELRRLLLLATDASGRRRKRAERDFGVMRARVAELIEDYSPLRELDAFRWFERRLEAQLLAGT